MTLRDSARPRSAARSAARRRSARPGFALGVALIFTLVIGALATAAIILTSNATLLARSVEHQRDLKYAAEAGLQLVKSRLDRNATLLPDSGQSQLMTNATIYSADGIPVPGIRVNVWVGPSGSLSGQFGNFASIVSQAVDNIGVSYVQRLEVIQESFARYAYWSNSETGPYGTIYFNNNDQLWGPVWSNDVLHIGTGGATFHDSVATAQYVSGAGYGTFMKGYLQYQRQVPLPTTTTLSRLSGYASSAGYGFTAPTTGDETTVLQRIEFVATDLNGDGDSLDDNEGFFRVYTANAGRQAWLRGDWPGGTSVSAYLNCGDWHAVNGYPDLKFFPAAVHPQGWFYNLMRAAGMSEAQAEAEQSASISTIMQHPGARCYPGGDPHLVAISRNTPLYGPAQRNKGGDDTTFTPVGAYGSWQQFTATPNAAVAAVRPDAAYLFPLSRALNANYKGVIYVAGTVGVSGTVRGRTTLYAHSGDIVLLDDVRYAHDPSLNTCADVLGLIADNDVVVADNGINTPQNVNPGGSTIWRSLDDTQDTYLQAVTMALNTSFRVQNFGLGPTSVLYCQGAPIGRGCLYVTGGIIQVVRGPVGTSIGTGYSKQYGYDACAGGYPPPYFPTTGRFTDNRYYEVNPIGFNVVNLFKSITSSG